MAEFGAGAEERMEAEFDRWKLIGDRRFGATGEDEAIEAVVRELADAGATTVLLQSSSGETDLEAYTDAVARIQQRLRG